jgi:GNAT superfamily N-acetyltransferase
LTVRRRTNENRALIRVRDLGADELPFLGQMLYAALAWRPESRLPPLDQVLAHPEAAIYHRDWGRPGDTALVAEENGRPVGAAWYRFFTAAEHGHGYVDDETPELAIAVVDGFRGRGVGLALLEAIHERARGDGLPRLALSVEPDNPAKRLYARLGYVDYEPGDGHGRMILDLG